MPRSVRVLVAVRGLSVLPAAPAGQPAEPTSSADPPLFETLGDSHQTVPSVARDVPTRRFPGTALREAGRAEAAERADREPLEDHTDEGWSPVGLENTLRAQDRPREADRVRRRFEEVGERGDVRLGSSRL